LKVELTDEAKKAGCPAPTFEPRKGYIRSGWLKVTSSSSRHAWTDLYSEMRFTDLTVIVPVALSSRAIDFDVNIRGLLSPWDSPFTLKRSLLLLADEDSGSAGVIALPWRILGS